MVDPDSPVDEEAESIIMKVALGVLEVDGYPAVCPVEDYPNSTESNTNEGTTITPPHSQPKHFPLCSPVNCPPFIPSVPDYGLDYIPPVTEEQYLFNTDENMPQCITWLRVGRCDYEATHHKPCKYGHAQLFRKAAGPDVCTFYLRGICRKTGPHEGYQHPRGLFAISAETIEEPHFQL
ncbi:hypothetical protein Pelo_4451 [Pelomyxa schiedti]|nr:hypothetical protein Pelo_4451 [Pelomyxa schiedti]